MNAHLRGGLRTLRDGVRELLAVRWVRVLAVLALLALGLRVLAEPILRVTLDRLAATRDLTCTWEDLDLELLAGRGRITRLEIAPRAEDGAAGEALVEIDYAIFDLDLSALLGGDVRIARAEVDGLTSRWVREADGTWNAARHVQVAELLELLESEPPPEDLDQTPSEREPIDLAPPVAIDALRLQEARVLLVDRSLEPPLALELALDAALSDLRAPGRPARFSATLASRGLVDSAHLEGEATWTADALRVEAWAHGAGLHAARLEPYLAPLDLHPAGGPLDARGDLVLALDVRGEARDTLGGELLLADVALTADGREALALDALSVVLDAWSPRGASLPQVELSGPRGRVVVEADGSVRLAGFAVTGDGWEEPARDWLSRLLPEMRGLPAWAALLVYSDVSAYPWRLGSLALRDGAFELEDRSVDPPALVPLLIDRMELREVVHDPVELERRIPLEVVVRVPGVLASATLSGHVDPFAPARHVDLRLAVEGLDPEGLDGYLRRMGLERDLHDGRFELALEGQALSDGLGRTEGRLEVRDVALRAERDLFGVDRIAAEGVVVDAGARLLRVGELSVEGPRLALGRDPSRRFFALGLRTLGLDAAAATPDVATPAPQQSDAAEDTAGVASAPAPLRVEMGSVRWSGTQVTLLDALHGDGEPLLVDALELELEELVLDGDPDADLPEPARLTGRLSVGGVVDALELEGRIQPRPGPIDLSTELSVRGRGLRAGALAAYLRPLGVEPELSDGTLALDLDAHLAQGADASWSAALELADLSLEDGGRALLGLERLRVADVRLGDVPRIGTLEVAGLRASLGRAADGALRLPALRLVGAEAVVADEEPGGMLPRVPWPALPPLELGRLDVSDVRLAWSDATLAPPLETSLEFGLGADGLGTRGAPATFEARLAVPETLEELRARGELRLGDDGAALAVEVEGAGLRAGPLARVLPGGVQLQPGPSAFHAAVEVEARPLADGGLALHAGARDVELASQGAEAPWVTLASAALSLALEPAADTLRVERAEARGLTLEARRDADGALHALGLRLARATPAPTVEPTEPADEPEASPPAAPPALPRVVLEGDVALEVARARLHDDAAGPDVPPFEGALELRVATPCVPIGPDAEELTPLEWSLVLGLDGLFERLRVDGRATPFAPEPALDVRVAGSGLRTQGLVERVPLLGERARGTLERGTFEAHLTGAFAPRRASPTEAWFARPFAADLELADVALRDALDGEVLAGVDRVAAEVRSVDLSRGLLHVAELEVETPRARIVRREDGALHALGLALSLEPTPQREPAPARPVAVEASAPRARTADGELRIDRVLLSGIDVQLADEAVEPRMSLPLVELDAQVSGLTTRLAETPGSVRFDAYLAAGRGAASGPGPVFEELSASGRLALHPEPGGRAQIGLSGLLLREFAGLAAELGLEIDDGALDARTRLRLRSAEELRVDTSLVFSDLDLSEPEGGWLQRTLSLPVALDTALLLLRDANGEHRLSTGLTLDPEGASGAQLAGAVARAFAEVLAGAVAGAPLRLLGAVVPLEDGPPPAASWTFEFEPGTTELGPDARKALDQAARYLEANPRWSATLVGELSEADLERADALANPPAEELRALVSDLRRQRAELEREHLRLVDRARVEQALGDLAEAPAALRTVARERADVERSLDGLLAVLRSDQPRRRARRARTTLREIAELRLEDARVELARRLDPDDRERLEVRTPQPRAVPELARGRVLLELRPR